MFKAIIISLLCVNSAMAVETTASVVEAVEFPVTISYSSGQEVASHTSSLQKVMDKDEEVSFSADIEGSGKVNIAPADIARIKATYCSNTYSANEFKASIRPSRFEVMALKVLQANNQIGKTKVVRLRLNYRVPYMGNALSTSIICD